MVGKSAEAGAWAGGRMHQRGGRRQCQEQTDIQGKERGPTAVTRELLAPVP